MKKNKINIGDKPEYCNVCGAKLDRLMTEEEIDKLLIKVKGDMEKIIEDIKKLKRKERCMLEEFYEANSLIIDIRYKEGLDKFYTMEKDYPGVLGIAEEDVIEDRLAHTSSLVKRVCELEDELKWRDRIYQKRPKPPQPGVITKG